MTELSLRRRLALLVTVAGLVTAALAGLTAVSLHRRDVATRDRVEVFDPAALALERLARAYATQDPAGVNQELRRLESVLAGRGLDGELAAVRDAGAATGALADLRTAVAAGRAEAARSQASHEKRVRSVLLMTLVGLVVLGVLTWQALRRWVTQPLAALGSEVERVEQGDISRQVTVGAAPTEIAQLGEQVERMRVRILHEYALAEASRAEADEARAQLEEQAEDLRRSNAELEQFAYVASHDLQEPLRKVASFCQLIQRRYGGQLDERGEQYIEFAVDGAKRMQQLINDLLAFSRVGRRSTEFDAVALEDVLAQALRQLSELLEQAEAEVTHDPLPVVLGDPSLLVQLLQNLIGNGVKFRSEQPPRVHLSARPDVDGFVEIVCKDNGIGIEDQYEEKIFVIFQRLHGREAYDGTGIGLAMCKKIVEFHGGRLWLDTAETSVNGSTFRFTLPMAASSTEERTRDDSAA